jgi:hypothetical protein
MPTTSHPFVPQKSRKVIAVALALFFGISLWIFAWSVRRDIKRACEPQNPSIQAVAEIIRRNSANPLEAVALVQVAADHLLDYDLSRRVYGGSIPTVSQMLARRRSAHWLFPRGDCKERAVIAGSLLSALHIPWEPVVSFPLRHAWLRVHVAGADWDIMTNPDRTLSWLGPTEFHVISFLAGGSGTPLRTLSAEFADQAVDRLVGHHLLPPMVAPEEALHDAAALGLVVVTPQYVYGHASVNFTALDKRLHFERDARSQARTAGFPLGEPL